MAEFNTSLSIWSNSMTGLITKDFEENNVIFGEYEKKCAMTAMSTVFNLMQSNGGVESFDTSNLRDVVGQAASLKLNANANPSECFFQVRNKKIGNNWVKAVELGIQGDGYDAILRNFGVDVKKVFPVWIVREGDDFTYPKHRGIEVTPPEWEQKANSGKCARVVYPVQLTDGTVQYLIAERESVRTNLIAHIKQNLMNETFGICADRRKATDAQLQQIADIKNGIYEELSKCETVDDMIRCEAARKYISGAWKDTSESMIIRKMRNNAIRPFTKDYSSFAKASMMKQDEIYKEAQEEIADGENSIDFDIAADVEMEVIADE